MISAPKFSIIIPVADYNAELKRFLLSLAAQEYLKIFEIIIVFNGQKINKYELMRVSKLLVPITKQSKVRLIEYSKVKGASPAWCYGIKNAKGKYVCLLASDTTLHPEWSRSIIKRVDDSADFYIGNYYGSLRKDHISNVESWIDKDRFNYKIIDFRNFIVNRNKITNLLRTRFKNKWFSDSELSIMGRKGILTRNENISRKALRDTIILNDYPNTIIKASIRKFKHGVGVGRIKKGFYIAKDFITPLHSMFQMNLLAVGSQLTSAEKLLFVYLNSVFTFGIICGYLMPKPLVERIYKFHFD